LYRPTAGAGRVNNKLPTCWDPIAHRRDLTGRHIRSDEVELVLHTIKRTVANQYENEIIARLCVSCHCTQRLPKLRRCGLYASEGKNLRRTARSLEYFIQILSRRGKSLLIIRLTAESCYNNVVRRSIYLQRKRQHHGEEQNPMHSH
jgi:hypothetical protein